MKTIGMLGGTGWSSTIDYYKQINMGVNARLGGYHSAKLLLKSVDYHAIMSNYGKDAMAVARALKQELQGLLDLKPDCFMICCNSLHKYFSMIKDEMDIQIPMLHALDLVAQDMHQQGRQHALLLATKFTMEDGFFARHLEATGLRVTVPNAAERAHIQAIHDDLMQNVVTMEARTYFSTLISNYASQYNELDTVILGCTELPMAIDASNSVLPLIDPVRLQSAAAVAFALADKN